MEYHQWKQFINYQSVPAEFVIANSPKTTPQVNTNKDLNFKNFLSEFKENMKEIQNFNQPIGLLAGAGTDSTFILAILIDCGFRNVHCVSLRQNSNSSALTKLDEVCSRKGIKHSIFDRDEINHEYCYDLFCRQYNRYPNDIAQPVHNALVMKLHEKGIYTVLDGQYADTLLGVNPQNKLIKICVKYQKLKILPRIISVCSQLMLGMSPIASKLSGKYQNALEVVAFNETSCMLLELLRWERQRSSELIVEKWIRDIGFENAFNKLFLDVTLTWREADKYRLVDVLSPFETFEIKKLILRLKEKDRLIIKKHMHSYASDILGREINTVNASFY